MPSEAELRVIPEDIEVSVPVPAEPAHKRYWRENKEKIIARRALRPKAPLRPLNLEKIQRYKEIQAQIKALQEESKKYVDEVRLMNRRGETIVIAGTDLIPVYDRDTGLDDL